MPDALDYTWNPDLGQPRRLWLQRLLVVPWFLFVLSAFLASLWMAGGIYFDLIGGTNARSGMIAGAWLLLSLAALLANRLAISRRALLWGALFLAAYLPWLAIRPSNERQWKPEWAVTGRVEFDGDTMTFHGYRDFRYAESGRIEEEHWQEHSVRLSNLEGVDFFLAAFGGDYIAHPMLSFDFGEDGQVVLSVETRREVGESYSELGGLYKMFELQYLFGSERDFVGVRALRDEPLYLYRSTASPERARELFLESVEAANALFEKPRWYNVITANCTTSLRAQTPADRRSAFDIRLLLNGKVDELLYEHGTLVSADLGFPELRTQSAITEAAVNAHAASALEFSSLIREGLPGFRADAATPVSSPP